MKPYHNILIIGITIGISYFIKERLNIKYKRERKTFFFIFMGYTILCYLCIVLLSPPIKAIHQKLTMDKYEASILKLNSYKRKIRSGKSPIIVQKITVSFKPNKQSNLITKELTVVSGDFPDIKKPYKIRYNSKTSNIISNSDTAISIVLIFLGFIPLFFVIYGVFFAFDFDLFKLKKN